MRICDCSSDVCSSDLIALRASPRPVTRLNRRTLAVAATLLAVAVAGASMWALQSKGRRDSGDQPELYNVDRIAKSADLGQLPDDYSNLPATPAPAARSEARPVGTEGVSSVSFRWAPYTL